MKQTRTTQARYVMGCVVEIIAETTDEEASVAAVNAAFEEFERLDRIFSRFDETSELAQLNRRAADEDFIASTELFDLVADATSYGTASGDVFDVTVAPLIDLWLHCAEVQRWPDAQQLNKARDLVGNARIELDRSRRSVRFRRSGMALDFGGFAKGYAVDRAIDILKKQKVSSALANAGASSIAGFSSPSADGWAIGIRHPLSEDHLIGSLTLRNAALSSSGGYERPLTIDGRNYSHILDPHSGLPASHALGATVITDSAARAEVMSKMLLMLGYDSAFTRFDELGWPAEGLLITEEPGGDVGVSRSAGLREFRPAAGL